MKNMKKLLQKAMVFTLAAAMLVGTPMTASAARLVDLYSTSDGTDAEGIDSGTATVTNTETGSSVLNEYDGKILGIALDRENIEAVVRNEETLNAQILTNEKISEEDAKKLASKIHWQVLNADKKWDADVAKALSIKVSAEDRTKATLDPKQGTQKELYVRASINNSWYVKEIKDANGEVTGTEVVEYANKENATVYEAFAKVTIKEYSTKLQFAWDLNKNNADYKEMPKVYEKHTIDLSKYVVRTSKTANDTLTWASDNKNVPVTAAGVITVKKAGEAFTIYVSGEKAGVNAKWVVTEAQNEKGVPASKIEFVAADGSKITKVTPDVDLGDKAVEKDWTAGKAFTVKAYAKVDVLVDDKKNVLTTKPAEPNGRNGKWLVQTKELAEGDKYIAVDKKKNELIDGGEVKTLTVTDEIAFTSNKTAIVNVKSSDKRTVTLVAPGTIGAAKITAKASSGKSAPLNIKVIATLRTLTIGGLTNGATVYTGQTFQLEALRDPKGNTEAVAWAIDKVNGKPNASAKINGKGLLTINNKMVADTVTVTLTNKKKVNGVPTVSATPITLKVKQSSIEGITVTGTSKDGVIASVTTEAKPNGTFKVTTSNGTDALTIPKNATYTATIKAGTNGDKNLSVADLTSTLNWETKNSKVVKISKTKGGETTLTATGIGKANISVSGVCVDGKGAAKVIKTTIAVTVTQPITSISIKQPTVVLAEKKTNAGYQNLKTTVKSEFGPKKFDKKSDSIVEWSWIKVGEKGDPTVLKNTKGNITTPNAAVDFGQAKAGEKYQVTVKTKNGLKATATIIVVPKIASASIASGLKTDKTPDIFLGGPKGTTKNALNLELGKTQKIKTYVNAGTGQKPDWQEAGTGNYEGVTYSVNKPGIVTIANDGTVYAVGVGKAVITAKTQTGKATKLTVEVKLPTAANAGK